MLTHDFLINIQHIHLLKVIKNHHLRHYIWEIAKVLIPALLTGFITFLAMRITDSRNKKRWLNDGHIKRKTELEIQIRKFLLGIKGTVPDEYYVLAGVYSKKNKNENTNVSTQTIYDFNKDYKVLLEYLKNEEAQRGSNVYDDKSIFALMDEYVCYVPKIQSLFDDFKVVCNEIIAYSVATKENPKDFKAIANIYLYFQDIVETILKKLKLQRLK